jgi:hypothetical protein
MAIFTTQADPQPMAFTELSIYAQSSTITLPTEAPTIDFCFCNYDCDYRELVLAGADDYQTDRSAFLITNPDITAGSFAFYLQNIVTGVETQFTDNTYGNYYALGYTPTNDDKGGYLINWGLVESNLGYGRYRVRIVNTVFGTDSETLSHEFNLKPYSPEIANGTVKIETVRTGCIQGGIDYTDLNWITSVRVKGFFYEIAPRTEIDTYLGTDRRVNQIQETTVRRYQLDTKLLPSEILNDLKNDGLMATNIFITDYNLLSYEDIRQINVIRTEFDTFDTYRRSRRAKAGIAFEEKQQDKIKRL